MQKSTHTAEYSALLAELRQARESAGLSQRALAAKLDVPHSWVAKVESGERRVDIVEFHYVLRACGADPTTVFRRLVEKFGKSRPTPSRGRRST
ncbi:MAG: helix-turn-helix transcriptional regulator [Planctomycetales bacterium]|nr:helix-turn-helix transcriptional regulator [Planctomycetales bacterium]MBN8628756.1 helix-turn-helix transcriptional regulator [Planctomycetota bacterium]